MAYGVKYRLEFSDILGYLKKVEILKKDYTGEVLPMVGSGEPVVVKWNTKDEFYTSIVGSSCNLNLMVTDTVQYDDFYKFNEREYQVKISYSETIPETYESRIADDGGMYESIECISSILPDHYKISTFYENNVNNDGGGVESLSCIAKNINDERVTIWKDYWIGWLVVDRFKEKMTAPPYAVSFNAFDGLGTLGEYDAPVSADDFIDSGNTTTDILRIADILQNLELELDIVCSNDLTFAEIDPQDPQAVPTLRKFPNTTTFPNYLYELKSGFDLYTAKEQLNLLLSTYNMRIFQSFGKWHIVENSNVFDSTVKNKLISLNEAQSSADNIRELINERLKSMKNEFVDTLSFSYLGVANGAPTIPTVKIAPEHLTPIENNLTREYLQPLSSVSQELTTSQLGKSYWNNNSGFEYGTYGWIIIAQRAEISTDQIDRQGSKSMRLVNAPYSGDFECFKTIRKFTQGGRQTNDRMSNEILGNVKFNISYYIDSPIEIPAQIRYVIYSGTSVFANPDLYWDNDNKIWKTSYYINEVEADEINSWSKIGGTLKDPSDQEDLQQEESFIRNLELIILNTTASQEQVINRTYFDNVSIFQDSDRFVVNRFQSELEKSNSSKVNSYRSDNTDYTSKKSFKSILFPTDTIGRNKHWFRSRDKFINYNGGVLWDSVEYKTISEIKNQNIMNDFRDFCIRYEGTFRNKENKPLSFENKIWFNWVDVIQDKEPSIIDGLTYGVKSGKFKVISHVPNNDNDLNIDVKISD
uniref:Uncharacterized protein n=1 Tax=uncultured marine virus TaxID=186617 RepID=A0A0F7L8T1_9VIRU|nr:hypothetical protein [uncultured marine virus]